MVCTGLEQSLEYVFNALNYNDYLIRKLKPLCCNVFDVLVFEDRFNSKQRGREFFDVCKYRKYLQSKEWITYEEFCEGYFASPKDALERLSLSEVKESEMLEFNKRLSSGEFTLKDFFHFTMEHKKLSMYRALRVLCEF